MSYKQAMELKKPIRVVYELYKQDHFEQAKADFAKQIQEQYETDYPKYDESGSTIEYIGGYYSKDNVEQEDGTFTEEWVLHPIDSDKPVKPSFDSYLEMKFDTEFAYTEPPESDIVNELREYAYTLAREIFTQKMNLLTSKYPEVEMISWKTQEEEARAYLSDNTSAVPMLSKIAERRGKTIDEVAKVVVSKADTYKMLSGDAIGAKHKAEDLIDVAQTISDLENALIDLKTLEF